MLLRAAAAGDARALAGAAAPAAYQHTAAAVLAAALWLWTLVANVASDGSAAPLPYVPLLNPLDVGIGLALVAALLWLQRRGRVAPWSMAMAAAAAFVWLNAILVRTFHHYGGVPYRVDAWAGSLAVQTGITLLWTAIALVAMWLASRARRALGVVCRRGAARRGGAEAARHRSVGRVDAHRLVHRRRRSHAGHRLRRAPARQGGPPCDS